MFAAILTDTILGGHTRGYNKLCGIALGARVARWGFPDRKGASKTGLTQAALLIAAVKSNCGCATCITLPARAR